MCCGKEREVERGMVQHVYIENNPNKVSRIPNMVVSNLYERGDSQRRGNDTLCVLVPTLPPTLFSTIYLVI